MPDPHEKPKPAPRLDYDPSHGAYSSTRRFRLLMGLTLLNTLMIAGLGVGPHVGPFFRGKWHQYQTARAEERERRRFDAVVRQCLAHAEPPGKVVYEEDPAEAAKLQAVPNGAYAPVLRGYEAAARVSRRRRQSEQFRALPGYQPPVRAAVPEYVNSFIDFAVVAGGGGGGGLFGGPVSYQANRLFGGPGPGGPAEPPLLFLHERTTPGGQRLLVEVSLEPGYEIGSNHETTDEGTFEIYGMKKRRRLAARAWTVPPAPAQPEEVHSWAVLLALPDLEVPELARVRLAAQSDPAGAATRPAAINYGNKLRVFAGQPDAADASRFTIAYQLDGKPGTIDGQVRDEEIVLRPREGAPANAETVQAINNNHGQIADEVWELAPSPAATQPSRVAPGGY